MNKILILLFLSFFSSLFGSQQTTEKKRSSGNYLFIFLLNPDDCTACLNNGYIITNFIQQKKIEKQKIIYLLQNKRKIVQTNYENSLKKLLNFYKLTLLWDSKLYSLVSKSNKIFDKMSILLVYDETLKKTVFKSTIKLVSQDKLFPYLLYQNK